MTDRHAAYIVTLGDDIRDDSPLAEATLTALRMVKGVVKVEPVVADHALVIAKARVDAEWQERIWQFARETNGIHR